MLLNLIQLLQKTYPQASYIVESSHKDLTDYHHSFAGLVVKAVRFAPKKVFNVYPKCMQNVDLVIDIGGLAYATGARDSIRNFLRHFYFVSRQIPIIFYTQDFGPAQSIITKLLGSFITRRSEAIFARSEQSFIELTDNLKTPEGNIKGIFPDSTFTFEPENFIGELQPPYCLIAPSAILYNKHGQKYFACIERLLSNLQNNQNVYILVHCSTLNGQSSDFEVATLLSEYLNVETSIISNVRSDTAKSIMAGAEYAITSRYHVLVGCLSVNTPCVCIGWNNKYDELLKLFDSKSLSISLNDNQSFKKIKDDVQNLNNSIEKVSEKLKQKAKAAEELLLKIIDEILSK